MVPPPLRLGPALMKSWRWRHLLIPSSSTNKTLSWNSGSSVLGPHIPTLVPPGAWTLRRPCWVAGGRPRETWAPSFFFPYHFFILIDCNFSILIWIPMFPVDSELLDFDWAFYFYFPLLFVGMPTRRRWHELVATFIFPWSLIVVNGAYFRQLDLDNIWRSEAMATQWRVHRCRRRPSCRS